MSMVVELLAGPPKLSVAAKTLFFAFTYVEMVVRLLLPGPRQT